MAEKTERQTERQTQSAMTPTREERRLARPDAVSGVSPFRALQRFADEIDRMFDDVGRRWTGIPPWRERTTADTWAPQIEVFQKDNELVVRADLPGMRRDDVTVEVTEDAVTIQGERRHESEEEREGLYRSERIYGSFYRLIPLPEGAITEQAKASFRDGVLEITMPVPPKSKGRRIEIGEGAKK
jgi:HSP20 family protein